MTAVITLRDPIVRPDPTREDVDPEEAFRLARLAGFPDDVAAGWAAWQLGLPVASGEEGPIAWTMREVRHLRSLRIEYAMGFFAGDRELVP